MQLDFISITRVRMCVCVSVYVCVCALGVGESWQQAWGRMQRDEAFLIKRKYLCLHTIPIGTWDNSENSVV